MRCFKCSESLKIKLSASLLFCKTFSTAFMNMLVLNRESMFREDKLLPNKRLADALLPVIFPSLSIMIIGSGSVSKTAEAVKALASKESVFDAQKR